MKENIGDPKCTLAEEIWSTGPGPRVHIGKGYQINRPKKSNIRINTNHRMM